MIGNDIVDLTYIKRISHWEKPGFLDKVFTVSEQALIHEAKNRHQAVWWLWSLKEAAYKCNVQQFGERFFNPKCIECQRLSESCGMVTINDSVYTTTSQLHTDYIYTIATQDHREKVHSSVFTSEMPSYQKQSEFLKIQVLKSFSKVVDLDVKNLTIEKTETGMPEIYHASRKLPIHLSLTHCGRFSGFVF
ncbi:MAG: 4-phosphopantetheinyl transferase family protein [Algicola sp.]|nr:4-phosphopantetheinyl transferase family protein [Algicola sp.]